MRFYLPLIASALLATPGLAQSAVADSHFAVRPAPIEQDSKAQSYALIGAVIGGVGGLLIDTARNLVADAPALCTTPSCSGSSARLSPPFGTSILIGTGVGLLAGALVGRLQDNRNQSVSVIPDAQRGTLSLSVRTRI